MAIVQNTLIGSASGKVGGTVFSKWKGLNVIKAKPLTVANPNTDLQKMQRSVITQLTALFRTFSAAINIGFKEQAVGMSQFNAFTRTNKSLPFNLTVPPAANIIYENLKFAKGTIAPSDFSITSYTASNGHLIVTWPTSPLLPGQSNNDEFVCVVINEDEASFGSVVTTVPRSVGTATMVVPTENATTGDNILVFGYFYNKATRKASDSQETSTTAL